MDAIITHEFADFDALAASVAAQRIYPGATIVLGRVVSPQVRDFLALHKDRFVHKRVDEIDLDTIRTLVVVDVRRASRLKAFDALVSRARAGDASLRIIVWDHHATAPDDLPAAESHVEVIGSATSLLVEEMRRRDLSVDAMEATLLALGIHADTGSLRFATATARDALALSWLMDAGASTRAIEQFLDPPLTLGQREVLTEVLHGTRVLHLAGFRIGLCPITAPDRCPGLDVVTSHSRAFLGLSVLVLAYEVEDKHVDVIARSATPLIDVGALLTPLGGGGHVSAASATVRGTTATGVVHTIETALRQDPPRLRPVSELMSSPVHVVAPDLPLERLAESLTLWGHSGAPVLDAGRLVGIISRRDVERARAQGALDVPVAGRMSQKVRTIAPNASVQEALERMKEWDVGRLPVLDGGALVGIVTRSDVLGELYER
jgi:tRNA nucleotidyltransferase (CCA-adding enzyme)